MKELIKPNTVEELYQEVSVFQEGCSRDCQSGGGRVCDKYCTDGAVNNSPIDENDILF